MCLDFYTTTVQEIIAEREYISISSLLESLPKEEVILEQSYRAWSTRPPPRIEPTLPIRTLLHIEARVSTRTAVVWILYGRVQPLTQKKLAY